MARNGDTSHHRDIRSHGPPCNEGELATPSIGTGELAVFEESNAAIDFEPIENTGFIIGSAVKHPHDLVLGPTPFIQAGMPLSKVRRELLKSGNDIPSCVPNDP
jgi:hypothetical protein